MLVSRFGYLLPSLARSLWVIGGRAESFERSVPILDRLLERRQGYPLVLSGAAEATYPWLAARYPSDYVIPLPGRWSEDRFIEALQPSLVIFLDPVKLPAFRRLHRFLQQRGIPTVSGQPVTPQIVAQVETSLPELRLTNPRESYQRPHFLLRVGQSKPARLAGGCLPHRRLDNWAAIAARLGRPKTMLCLGNGPSSETPELTGDAHDCLFRVNWIWRNWSAMRAPDVVIVGNTRLPRAGRKPLLGFRTEGEAAYTFLRQLLRLNLRRYDYFVLEQLPSALAGKAWSARPSGGIVMLAAAAALQPRRIVIAGLDLYRHPDGRYPGRMHALNAYARVHDRQVEIRMIRHILSGFAGAVEIRSPILAESLVEQDVGAIA